MKEPVKMPRVVCTIDTWIARAVVPISLLVVQKVRSIRAPSGNASKVLA